MEISISTKIHRGVSMKFIKSKKLMLNLMATGGVVAGMAIMGGMLLLQHKDPISQLFLMG